MSFYTYFAFHETVNYLQGGNHVKVSFYLNYYQTKPFYQKKNGKKNSELIFLCRDLLSDIFQNLIDELHFIQIN